uniref:Response regulatory domain-containing protein n=1 Tax=Leersia perrieri TaxID=77586 RepID=A0A0D9WPX7_9ORYZ
MAEQMVSFFPDGLRVMVVDDDTKAKTATTILSAQHYSVVATCSTIGAAVCALSGDNGVDVQAILCDIHKVVFSGFDFRHIVETKLHVPVIYLLSMDDAVEGEEAGSLDRLLENATYIVKKPLDPTMMAHLWRVVAWRKCYLEVNMAAPADGDASSGDGESDDDEAIIIEEPQIQFKAVQHERNQKRQLAINNDDDNNRDDEDAHPAKILEHMNVEDWKEACCKLHYRYMTTLFLGGTLAPLWPQKYRAQRQQQKREQLDDRRLFQSSDSVFLKAILPTLNPLPSNPLIPSSIVTASSALFAGGSAAAAAAPFQAPVLHQQPAATAQQVYSGAALQLDSSSQKLFLGALLLPRPSSTSCHHGQRQGSNDRAPPVDDLLAEVGESAHDGAMQNNGAAASSLVAVAPPIRDMADRVEAFTGPDQVAADPAAIVGEQDITFSLEDLLGLDNDALLPLEDGGADDAGAGGEEGGMEIGWDLDLDDFLLMGNNNDLDFQLDDLMAGNE